MKIASKGAKSAILISIEESFPMSVTTRESLEKLNMRQLLALKKDLELAFSKD